MKIEGTTLRDVALEAGVSIDTVSRVLNGKGKMKWASAMRRATEIKEIAERLNYRPNAAARAIRSSRTKTVGALVRNNPRDRYIHPVAFETLLGINEGLEAAGYVLSVIRYDDVESKQANGSRVFREHMLDGMIVIGGMSNDAIEQLQALLPRCVWANSNVWTDNLCIHRDEIHVGETAGRMLTSLGYRRIVLLGGAQGSVPHYSQEDRFTGLKKVAAESGATVEWLRIPWTPRFSPATFPMDLLDPSVVFVTQGVSWAQWIAQLAAGIGKVAPYDFGLASCDESGEIARYWPGLNRVSFDNYEMGVLAARMMLQSLQDPETPVPSQKFRGHWIPGNTAWGPRSFR